MQDFTSTFYGRPNTVRTYTSLFNRKIKKEVLHPETWRAQDLQSLVDRWMARQLAPNTIKTLIRLTKEYIIWSGGESLDTRRLVSYAMKSKQKVPVKALTVEQAQKLMEGPIPTELRIPIALGLYAGLRRGEVFGLGRSDIDLINRKVCIRRSYDGPTKSGLSRVVPISKNLYSELKLTLAPASWNFKRIIRKPFDPNPGLKKACRKLGLPEITFHGLRHTFATAALQQGRSLKEVSTALGHVSVTTTIDIYWQCLEQMDVELF